VSPTCLDVLAAPQHPVIGETSFVLSSTARCEYGCSLAAIAIECRKTATLPDDILGNSGQTGISSLWPESGKARDLLGCGMQTLALRR
jgi:hypothetical protein